MKDFLIFCALFGLLVATPMAIEAILPRYDPLNIILVACAIGNVVYWAYRGFPLKPKKTLHHHYWDPFD